MSKIKQWIKKGEGKTIEFKRTLPDGNHIAKTVIAFSNMAGGLFFKIILYKKKRQQTTIETTKETTAKTTGKDSKKTTVKTNEITLKGLIDNNFKDKKTTTKTTKETTAKTSTMLIELELIRKKPNANLNELAEHLQLTMDGVRYHLKNLKQKGILKRIGSSREGYWKINEDRIPKSTIQ